jgi:hypothetical protein
MQQVEIRVRGHINQNWIDCFDKLTITYSQYGTSILNGAVRDQAELRGILCQLADLGFELVSVTTNGLN